MKQLAAALTTLHQSLLEALDAGDVEQVTTLIARRKEGLDELNAALRAASSESRRRMQPDLDSLLALDHDLQARMRTDRDALRRPLDAGQAHAQRRDTTVVTGVIDRKA